MSDNADTWDDVGGAMNDVNVKAAKQTAKTSFSAELAERQMQK